MTYEPTNIESRNFLGNSLIVMLLKAGFERTVNAGDPVHGEAVFFRSHHAVEGIDVLVYTSCVEREGAYLARPVGADAIRVCAVYHALDGTTRGIAKADKRVNRVGEVEDIVERTLTRMREVYGSVPSTERCRCCGAPVFESKKGNLVCAELCWKK